MQVQTTVVLDEHQTPQPLNLAPLKETNAYACAYASPRNTHKESHGVDNSHPVGQQGHLVL